MRPGGGADSLTSRCDSKRAAADRMHPVDCPERGTQSAFDELPSNSRIGCHVLSQFPIGQKMYFRAVHFDGIETDQSRKVLQSAAQAERLTSIGTEQPVPVKMAVSMPTRKE